jgi:hypothetical protein
VRRFFVSELSRPVCEAEHIHCRISARCKLPVVPIGLRSGALQFRKIRNRFFVVPLLSGGAYASSRTWSGMRWTRKAPKDERRVFRGRRSRVVLARPCRRQVSLEMMRTTVAIKLVHRGEREVSRKPPRRECRAHLWTSRLLRKFLARRPTGACGHPVFPAPSSSKRGKQNAKPGRKALREGGNTSSLIFEIERELTRNESASPIISYRKRGEMRMGAANRLWVKTTYSAAAAKRLLSSSASRRACSARAFLMFSSLM